MGKSERRQAIMAKLSFVLLAFCLAPGAHAASFDCGKATMKVEKMICADPKISALDDALARAYQNMMSKASIDQKKRVLAEQRHWLKYTRNACSDLICFKHAYWSRQAELETFFEPHSPLYKHESEKAEAIKHILATKQFESFYSNDFCNQIFEDLKQMNGIEFVDPVVQVQSYEDPALDPWKRQSKSKAPFHYNAGCGLYDGRQPSPAELADSIGWCQVHYGLPPFKLFELQPLEPSGQKQYLFYSDDDYGPMNQVWGKSEPGYGYSGGFTQLNLPGFIPEHSFTETYSGARYGGNYNSVIIYHNQYYQLLLFPRDTGSYLLSFEQAMKKQPYSPCMWSSKINESEQKSK